MRRVACSLLLLLAAVAAPPARAAEAFRIAPPPVWVEPRPPDLSRPPATTNASGGLEYLVIEEQVRTGPGPAQRYHHLAKRVLSPKGIENGSELRIDFAPSSEQLTLHAVTIHRRGARLDALRRSDVKVIQREPDLDRRLFDGALTAVLFLRDVRQGDVIETAYTVSGSNPVFGGRWAGTWRLGARVPVAELSFRLVTPEGRPIHQRVHGLELTPTVVHRGGATEYRWDRTAVPAAPEESDLPPGLDPAGWLELSEWEDWGAVVDWALPLYATPPPSAAMRERLDAWRALPDEAARAQAALRFVQDEVRYLGIELGASSHRPHPPAEVLARRFGDCKDKSLLLVTLLRALGIEASPALVSTEDEAAVEARLPSPTAFDHVIVRARIAGEARWLEPTRSLERAPIAALAPPPYRRALVLAPGARGLTAMPEPIVAPLRVVTTWRVARFGAPVALEIATTYEGLRAVGMRHALAETTPAELQERYLEYYARRDPKIASAGPLEIADAPDADRLTVRERYELPPLDAGDTRGFSADAIREELVPPETALRKLPLRIAHPVAISEQLRVELPGPPDLDPDARTVAGKAARLEWTARAAGHAYVIDLAYRSLASVVEPAAAAAHLAALREMRAATALDLPLAVRPPRAVRGDDLGWGSVVGIGALLLCGVLVVIGVTAAMNGDLERWRTALRSSGRRRAFRAKLRATPGDSAMVPLAVRAASDVPVQAARVRCGCGAAFGPPAGPPEVVRYDGRELVVHVLSCERCRGTRRIYFAVEG